jgi:polyisoprenoid-binding protein YceI
VKKAVSGMPTALVFRTAIRGALGALRVAALLCGLSSSAPALAEDRLVDLERSTVTVRVYKAGLFSVFADDHIVQAPLAEGSFDEAVPHVQIVIDPRRMRVLDPGLSEQDRQQVQARMLGPDVLDVNRFQRISFHSITAERLAAGKWLVRGELELHGRIREIPVNVSFDKGRYTGSATLRQSDYGIAPISLAGGTVKVKDEIRIDFDVAISDRLAMGSGGSRGEPVARAVDGM